MLLYLKRPKIAISSSLAPSKIQNFVPQAQPWWAFRDTKDISNGNQWKLRTTFHFLFRTLDKEGGGRLETLSLLQTDSFFKWITGERVAINVQDRTNDFFRFFVNLCEEIVQTQFIFATKQIQMEDVRCLKLCPF